jgi:hypothetical protein
MARELILLEGQRILFRNFAGEKKTFNEKGERNFAIALEQSVADELERKHGFKIKYLKQRDEDEAPQAILHVKVNFRGGAGDPRLILITEKNKTLLTAETAMLLDSADIKNVDIKISPYHYDVNGNTGTKAYLDTIYVTINEDYLDRKYSNLEIETRDYDEDHAPVHFE